MDLMGREVRKKNQNIVQNAVNSTLASMAVLLVSKAGGFSHEVLFARDAAGCGTVLLVIQPCGDTVSGNIAAIRWLRVLETKRNAF